MGCGKTSAAGFFAEAGWSVLSADILVQKILASNDAVRRALSSRWGVSVVDEKGQVNRDAIADLVFKDLEELNWLEGLLHPLVQDEWTRAVKEKPSLNWVIEIPLLFEKRLEKDFDFIVCITCPYSTVITRMVHRGFSAISIEQRSNQQMALSEKEDRADFVITNSGSLKFLKKQTLSLIAEL